MDAERAAIIATVWSNCGGTGDERAYILTNIALRAYILTNIELRDDCRIGVMMCVVHRIVMLHNGAD